MRSVEHIDVPVRNLSSMAEYKPPSEIAFCPNVDIVSISGFSELTEEKLQVDIGISEDCT